MAFDLDLAIRSWRDGLERSKAFLEGDLEELERHLRDDTASLAEEADSEQEAFRVALARLGDLGQLETAYRTVFWRKLKHRKQAIGAAIDHLAMFRSYLTTGLRSLMRHRGYSAVNISGLAVGLACSFLIVLWIQGELAVDRFHENELVQIRINDSGGERVNTWRNVPYPLAEVMASGYPEVEQAVLTLPITAALTRDEFAARERGYFAGPGFFEAFTFPLLRGDPSLALQEPNSVLISAETADKYFGPDWQHGRILGEAIRMNYWQSAGGVLGEAVTASAPTDLTVTGVFEDVPPESSLHFDFVLPASQVVRSYPHVERWGPRWFEMTLRLRPGTDLEVLNTKIAAALSDQSEDQEVFVQPVKEAHLHGAFEDGVPSGGRVRQVYLIGLIGLAILAMACINFANLVTARSSGRAREIGVRKSIGATPTYLVHQFLSEAVLTTLVALLVAIALTILVLPTFNTVTGTAIRVSDLTLAHWAVFVAIALVTAGFAGSYPAFYLAALNPVRVLRGHGIGRRRGEAGIRKGLVVFQFAVSALLVVGTLTVYRQLSYLQTKDLGLDKENVVMMRMDGDVSRHYDTVRETLLQTPGIEAVSRSSEDPVAVAVKNSNVLWAGQAEGDRLLFTVIRTDDQFAEVLKPALVEGRFFESARDAGLARFVVNEAAVEAMGLESPIGHPFAFGFDLDEDGSGMGQIVGVVSDFHTGSLVDEEIGPLVFRYEPEVTRFLLARIGVGQTARALDALEEVHAQLNPGYPFEYTFLDESNRARYRDQSVLGSLSQVFAFVALFIACLGLLGLSAFSVQRRTKEIGVRRVLGATKSQLLLLLSRDFLATVGIALAAALPLGYWAMGRWLTSFAYRVELGFGTLLFAAGLSLVIAMAAVGSQAYRAIRLGTVRSLRSE